MISHRFERKQRKPIGEKFKNIAKLIREAREAQELTQEQLSMILGYKKSQFISNIERGLCGLPSKLIVQVSEELGIEVSEIITVMCLDLAFQLRADVDAIMKARYDIQKRVEDELARNDKDIRDQKDRVRESYKCNVYR